MDFDLVGRLDDYLVPIEKEAYHKQKGFLVALVAAFLPDFFRRQHRFNCDSGAGPFQLGIGQRCWRHLSEVVDGGSQTFDVPTPVGFELTGLEVDGAPVEESLPDEPTDCWVPTRFTVTDVTGNHTIVATVSFL